MKIELIKEKASEFEVWYRIEKDGMYVDCSYTKDIEKAKGMYNSLVASNGKTTVDREILESTEL